MSKTITKEMTITEIVQRWPETAGTFLKHGMHCLGCAAARFENVEQGAVAHGIDAEALVEDLNSTIEDKE